MFSSIKLYVIGALTFIVGILAFLLQHSKLKAKTIELKKAKKIAQVDRDVIKILKNRNVRELLKNATEKLESGDISSLDD